LSQSVTTGLVRPSATFGYDDVECYLQAGWEIAADLSDCYHGQFGVLMMRWPFDGPEDT
jgi:hypothetical protein